MFHRLEREKKFQKFTIQTGKTLSLETLAGFAAEAGKYELMFQIRVSCLGICQPNFGGTPKNATFYTGKNSFTVFITFGRALLINFSVTLYSIYMR